MGVARPHWVLFGNLRPISAKLGLCSTSCGRFRPNSGRFPPTSGYVGPTGFDQIKVGFDRIRVLFFFQIWPASTNFESIPGNFVQFVQRPTSFGWVSAKCWLVLVNFVRAAAGIELVSTQLGLVQPNFCKPSSFARFLPVDRLVLLEHLLLYLLAWWRSHSLVPHRSASPGLRCPVCQVILAADLVYTEDGAKAPC